MPLFLITYVNKDNYASQWFEEELKTSFKQAEDFLKNKGFINRNGFYERPTNGWYGNTRAFINPMSISSSKIKLFERI